MNQTKKVIYSAVFITLGLIVPQVFHFTGVVNSGAVFLPMHIPVIIGGFVLGPVFGMIVGGITPFLSGILLGMPPMARMPFMIIELAVYAFIAGLLYNTLGLRKRKFGIYITLIVAMILGRVVYAISLWIAADLLGIGKIGPMAAVDAVVKGVPGIIIQLILIPMIVYQLKRGKLMNNE